MVIKLLSKRNYSALTNEMTMSTYSTSITVAATGTSHKEASIGILNFIPMACVVTVTSAAANAVNLVDVGTDADTDGFIDGITVAINSTGFKGFFLLMCFRYVWWCYYRCY